MKGMPQNRVSVFRTRAQVTQEVLAEAVDVSRQTIIAIERGNYTPSVFLALKLGRFFKCKVDDLFFL